MGDRIHSHDFSYYSPIHLSCPHHVPNHLLDISPGTMAVSNSIYCLDLLLDHYSLSCPPGIKIFYLRNCSQIQPNFSIPSATALVLFLISYLDCKGNLNHFGGTSEVSIRADLDRFGRGRGVPVMKPFRGKMGKLSED